MDTAEHPPKFLVRPDGTQLAYRYLAGKGPLIVFLPGYMSDMQGGKAQAVEAWARQHGRAVLRLDYSGCGESGGDFSDGSLSLWHDDAMLLIDTVSKGPVQLIGSSMGGWLMLMIGKNLGKRLSGMIGIAAAPDFTDWGYDASDRAIILTEGVLLEENPYGPEPTPTYRKFLMDGDANLLLDTVIPVDCPVHLLHGQCDDDVPWNISLRLAAALRSSNVQIHLLKDGDHRLSRDQDIALLLNILSRLPA